MDIFTGEPLFKDKTVLAPPTTKEICDMILRHAKMLIEAKGEYTGIREMRKHFAWYGRHETFCGTARQGQSGGTF